MSANLNKLKGFSLVELFAALSIISLIAVMSLPTIGQVRDKQRLKSAVQHLQASLNLARSLAIKRGESISVCAQDPASTTAKCMLPGLGNGEWQKGWLIYSDLNNNQQIDGTEKILSATGAIPSVTIRSSSKKSRVKLSAFGASILSNQTWEICLPKSSKTSSIKRGYRLILSSPGQIRPVTMESC